TPTLTSTVTPTATATATLTPTNTVTPTATPTRIPGDINGDCLVDIRDYGVWRQHFGEGVPPGSTLLGVPAAPRNPAGPLGAARSTSSRLTPKSPASWVARAEWSVPARGS